MTREIQIVPVLNGYICRVGCQTVVFQGTNEMLVELGDYLRNPEKVETHYLKHAVNKPCMPGMAEETRQPNPRYQDCHGVTCAENTPAAGSPLQ